MQRPPAPVQIINGRFHRSLAVHDVYSSMTEEFREKGTIALDRSAKRKGRESALGSVPRRAESLPPPSKNRVAYRELLEDTLDSMSRRSQNRGPANVSSVSGIACAYIPPAMAWLASSVVSMMADAEEGLYIPFFSNLMSPWCTL